MPLQSTSGAASYDAFGGGVAAKVNYIEDFFQSYLRTGTGASATITTGLDGSTKETLVWTKSRSAATNHKLTDNVRGATKALSSNTTSAEATDSQGLTAFSATGYTIGTNTDYNNSGATYVDWQWVSQPKFFDVVTYTGNGTNGRTVAHSLGSVPGCIIVKEYSNAGNNWQVYHRSIGNTKYLRLNTTAAETVSSTRWNNTDPTDTVFTLGTDSGVNANGASFVAYVFAHDAGGFGLTGTDNVVSCGSYTTNGSGVATVDLGYEPQWVLTKATSGTFGTTDWVIADNMRGMPAPPQNDGVGGLFPNTSGSEDNNFNRSVHPTSTGFVANQYASTPYIYIAIRRGPMKVPTSGTSVFEPTAFTSQAGNDTVSSGSVSVVDWGFVKKRTSAELWIAGDRLRGGSYLSFDTTSAEASNVFKWDKQNAFVTNVDDTPSSFIGYSFRRAPSFFDEVCYTGNGAGNNAKTHNLGVAPELLIIKNRSSSGSGDWFTFHTFTSSNFKKQLLDTTDAQTNYTYGSFLDAQPTSTTFTVNSGAGCNESGTTYVAYLFATCAGVSKVGTYTGTATTLQIDCGFIAGARFVLIKRTDATGSWYVWDSSRGIVSGNDPYLLLNSTAAEVTNTDYIDAYSAGFEISSTAPAEINASGGTFIFFAVA